MIADETTGKLVTVTVIDINANQIKLGIDAPRDIAVHREEIYERIQAGVPMPTKSTSTLTTAEEKLDEQAARQANAMPPRNRRPTLKMRKV